MIKAGAKKPFGVMMQLAYPKGTTDQELGAIAKELVNVIGGNPLWMIQDPSDHRILLMEWYAEGEERT